MIAVAVSAVLAWQFTSRVVLRESLRDRLVSRAQIIGHALGASMDVYMAATLGSNQPDARGLLERIIGSDDALRYIVVVSPQGAEIVFAPAGEAGAAWGIDAPATRAALIRTHLDHVEGGDDDAIRLTMPLHFPESHDGQPVTGPAEGRAADAYALMGLSTEADETSFGQMMIFSTATFAGLLVLALWALLVGLFRRLERLREYAQQVADGDLTRRLNVEWRDEFGQVASALESISHNLGETISRVGAASVDLNAVSSEVRSVSQRIAVDAGSQAESVTRTADAMTEMSVRADAVDRQIQQTTESAELSATRLRDISGAVQNMTELIEQIAGAIDESRKQRDSNIASVGAVERAVVRLNESAATTATASAEIAQSIQSVERSTEVALTTAQTTSKKAAVGVKAMAEIVRGIDGIKVFAVSARSSMESLAFKVREIENILEMISEVANQTRLLSLNASIIAVQAGEHGRGFLVVADEIKALAAKTGSATLEIGTIVEEILSNFGGVLQLVEDGVRTVDHGVERTAMADESLAEIRSASEETGRVVRHIAQAMTEQSNNAQRVDGSVQDVYHTAKQVQEIVANQREQGERLEQAIREIKRLIEDAVVTTNEQGAQARQAIQAMRNIFEQVRSIAEDNRQQGASREEVAKAFEALAGVSERHRDSASGLIEAVEQAAERSRHLVEDVKAFRV